MFIFTDSQTESSQCLQDYVGLSCGKFARKFYSVVLNCDAEENERRLLMADRGHELNGKLTGVVLLKKWRSEGSTFYLALKTRSKLMSHISIPTNQHVR